MRSRNGLRERLSPYQRAAHRRSGSLLRTARCARVGEAKSIHRPHVQLGREHRAVFCRARHAAAFRAHRSARPRRSRLRLRARRPRRSRHRSQATTAARKHPARHTRRQICSPSPRSRPLAKPLKRAGRPRLGRGHPASQIRPRHGAPPRRRWRGCETNNELPGLRVEENRREIRSRDKSERMNTKHVEDTDRTKEAEARRPKESRTESETRCRRGARLEQEKDPPYEQGPAQALGSTGAADLGPRSMLALPRSGVHLSESRYPALRSGSQPAPCRLNVLVPHEPAPDVARQQVLNA